MEKNFGVKKNNCIFEYIYDFYLEGKGCSFKKRLELFTPHFLNKTL
jgi:hypothetical protein